MSELFYRESNKHGQTKVAKQYPEGFLEGVSGQGAIVDMTARGKHQESKADGC